MKLLLSVFLISLCVLGAVVAQPQSTAPSATVIHPTEMNPDAHVNNVDPIYAEYERKARELYLKALIDYYHAHPSRLSGDLSRLTSMEYESMVPTELIDAFHLDRAKIEQQIKENDAGVMEEMDQAEAQQTQADQHDMETIALEQEDEPATDLETSQFGRFGRFGGGFGRGFGGFGRFGGFGGFGRFGRGFGGFGGFGRFGGFGLPGFGFGRFGFGRFGFGRFGFPGFGFGWRRFGWI